VFNLRLNPKPIVFKIGAGSQFTASQARMSTMEA
jgi:threonine/homoserine/homoserine lactone efflux protein